MHFKKHYIELDMLRAVAIMLVSARHFFAGSGLSEASGLSIERLALWGWHGVDLFFALSGFLIGGQIIEEASKGSFSFKGFYVKRFWRIFPPYYASIIVYILVKRLDMGEGVSLKNVLVHLLYLQNYIHFEDDLGRGIYWSLAIEEQFYILMPVLLWFFARYARRFLPSALTLIIAAVVIGRFILFDASKDWRRAFFEPFHARLDNLFFGVLAACVFIYYKDRPDAGAFFRKAALPAIAALALGATFFYGGYGIGYFNVCWQFTATGAGFSALVLYAALNEIGRHVPFKRFTGIVARLSYGMYLYNILVLSFVRRVYVRHVAGYGLPDFFTFIVYIVLLLAVAGAMYMLVDRPSMNYRKRLLERMLPRPD